MMLRVRDRRSGNVRTVTHLAYAAMGPKVYEKLGPADEVAQPAKVQSGPIHRAVSAPVVKPQIIEQAPEPESQPTAQDAVAEATPVKVKGKPGRKPKTISSDADATEK